LIILLFYKPNQYRFNFWIIPTHPKLSIIISTILNFVLTSQEPIIISVKSKQDQILSINKFLHKIKEKARSKL